MEIEGITWTNGAIDAEPGRVPDAIERRMDEHMDRCGVCTFGNPEGCAMNAIVDEIPDDETARIAFAPMSEDAKHGVTCVRFSGYAGVSNDCTCGGV